MNQCSFYGKLKSKNLSKDGTPEIEIEIEVMEVRKSRNKDKVVDKQVLRLKAWDSAAVAIDTYCDINGYILIPKALARNDEKGVYFRISEFKVINEN